MRNSVAKLNFNFLKTKLSKHNNKTHFLKNISINFSQSEDGKCDKIDNFKEELKKQNENIEKEEDIKITDFFKFMDENIQKETEAFLKNKQTENSNSDVVDDVNELLSLVKCPITDDDLEACEEGLKISVIINIFEFF